MTILHGWHGSPWGGIEREGFRLDNAGSGADAGSQDGGAFGWGVYFSMWKDRALGYREILCYNNEDKLRQGVHEGKDGRPGQLYSAKLPDTDTLLHWDKKLRDQPLKVREAIRRLDWYRLRKVRWQDIRNMEGRELYDALTEHHDNSRNASLVLAAVGISGNIHLDLFAESNDPKEYDIVVWDECYLTPEAAEIKALF